MDGIGKVDGGGACGQGDDSTLGGVDEDLVVEHVDFQGLDEFLRIGILLGFQQTANPLEVLLRAGTGALLVFPVGGNAVFRSLVHVPGADLHLEGNALGADDGGVKTLVHIGLGGGDVVLEPAGYQIEQVVDVAQHVVAVGNGVHDDPEGVDVVKLVDGLSLSLHFPVDGVYMLDPAVGLVVDAHGGKPLGDFVLDGAHEHLILLLVGVEVIHDLIVGIGHQVLEGDILQLPLDLLHTQAVRQRRVNIHGLPAFFQLLFRGLVLHGAHIVKPVGDLDEHHPDVLGHGHEHLAQVFHLSLLGGGEVGTGQLGDALHQLGNGGAENSLNVLVGSVGVLNAVVKQRTQHRVAVQAHFRHDLGDGQGVNDVGGAVLALLGLVLGAGIVHGLVDERPVSSGNVLVDGSLHGGIVFFKGFHFLQLSFARSSRCMVWLAFRSAFSLPGVSRMVMDL